MIRNLKTAWENFKLEIKTYRLVLEDSRTPWLAKFLLGLAVAYALSPVDIIPDFIPVLGHLDDAVIVPLLVVIALKWIPRDIVTDCRLKAGRPN